MVRAPRRPLTSAEQVLFVAAEILWRTLVRAPLSLALNTTLVVDFVCTEFPVLSPF